MTDPNADCSGSDVTPRDDTAPVFHLAILSGCWEIHDQTGNRGGLFRTRQAAIRYARHENPNRDFVIVDETHMH